MIAGLAGCGGDVNFGDQLNGPSDGSEAAAVKLIAASPQLPSGAFSVDDGITLTAIVKDSQGQLLAGAPVTFSAPDAAVQVVTATTDITGSATGVLTTGGDPTNRIVQVSASSGGAHSESVPVAIVGSALQINGPTVVGSGAPPVTYTLTLLDSAGKGMPNTPVIISNATTPGPNNPISATTVLTDFDGKATFTYTGEHGGTDTLVATSSGATTSLDVTVTPDVLAFSSPAPGTFVPFGHDQVLTVRLTTDGAPTAGKTISFKTTRGYFDGTPGKTSTTAGPTNSNGEASVHITTNGGDGAGEATIAAEILPSGPSTSLTIVFIATTPTSIDVQASPSTIATLGTSTITAVLRDAANNLVANQPVDFRLSDSTGGSLSAVTGVTNSQGSISVVYRASQTPSATNGVVVNARVHNFPAVDTCTAGGNCAPPFSCPVGKVCSPALITVGGQALFITLGTGNKLTNPNETAYQMPWDVQVTDAAGQPAPPNTVFRLQVISKAYQKGAFLSVNCLPPWVPSYTIPAPSLRASFGAGCPNEDINGNGILDPGEDADNSGGLDPGNVVSVPATLPLDVDGKAQFNLTYPQDHAFWVQVTLRAIASVAGTESVKETSFVLPGLADDYSDCDVSPPGQISPYGTGSSCASTVNAACSNGLDEDGDGLIDDQDPACFTGGFYNPLLDTEDKADLTVSLTPSPTTGAVGANITYTVKVTNNGPEAARVVTLTDAVPDDTTFVSNSGATGWTCNNPVVGVDGVINCTRSSLDPAASSTFTIVVKVNDTVESGLITDTVSVSSSTFDPVSTNNTRSRDVTVPQCADGIDNDDDGLIDLADPECASATDTDESS
jgi:uncharacterized repeat protein (TIGR01451 family)